MTNFNKTKESQRTKKKEEEDFVPDTTEIKIMGSNYEDLLTNKLESRKHVF